MRWIILQSVQTKTLALCIDQGQYADAAQAYEKALALQSSDFRIWGHLASAYYWSDRKQIAVETYRKAAAMAEEQYRLNPRDPILLYTLAGYYSMIGRQRDARSLLGRALTIAPKDVRVTGRSAMVYEQLGKRELALQWLEKAFQLGFSPSELDHDPVMKNLRADRRYQELVSKSPK